MRFATVIALGALVAGVAHPSTSEGPLSAGSYSFQAHYSGDDNYSSGTDKCEKVTVGKGTPTVNTQIHLGTDGANPPDVQDTTIAFQSTIHDRAAVTRLQEYRRRLQHVQPLASPPWLNRPERSQDVKATDRIEL